ncbi:MAG: toxin-antitoxin system TumE family protein, partial [Anaerolineae bacterium]
MIDLNKLSLIVAREFADIVVGTEIIRDKLRVALKDGSYVDFWWSASILGRFAHHWERTHVDGTIYRHDNMPHPAAKHL